MEEGATKGLEDFLKVINYLAENYKGLEISLNILLIPEGKAFSCYQDGARRNCAVVKLERQGKLPCYIIEVGRADGWSISTLLIYQLVVNNLRMDIDKLIQGMLKDLVDNSGHWEKRSLEKEVCYKFDMMKHISGQRIANWGERVLCRYN
jgi:hypothetical protein